MLGINSFSEYSNMAYLAALILLLVNIILSLMALAIRLFLQVFLVIILSIEQLHRWLTRVRFSNRMDGFVTEI